MRLILQSTKTSGKLPAWPVEEKPFVESFQQITANTGKPAQSILIGFGLLFAFLVYFLKN